MNINHPYMIHRASGPEAHPGEVPGFPSAADQEKSSKAAEYLFKGSMEAIVGIALCIDKVRASISGRRK